MARYLFNSNIHGYETSNVDNFSAEVGKDDTLIIIIDEACSTNAGNYYKLVDNALRNQSRVILIGVGDGTDLFNALASNMLVYNNYGIYKVVDKDSISADYLLKIQDRNPDLSEAQAFLDSEVVAYQDLCTLLYGIESLVSEGNMDGLKVHVERHLTTIEGMVTAVNKMKKTCEVFNSNELIDNIKELKDKVSSLNDKLSEQDKQIDDIKHNRDEYKVETENLKRELAKTKSEMPSVDSAKGQNVIKSYTAYNTAIYSNNKALVIYFKEISYLRYMNTLVTVLCEYIDRMKLNWKLLIYDNNTNMIANYGLDVITGDNYAADKATILKKKKVVVAEPFQSIIQDVISSKDAVDVVIVYDRLKQYEDIVKGNNVTKFFVANSANDITKNIKTLNIDDTGNVITDARTQYSGDNTASVQFLDIPYLADNFSKLSPSAVFQKYVKAKTTRTQVNLVATLIKKSHIEGKQ